MFVTILQLLILSSGFSYKNCTNNETKQFKTEATIAFINISGQQWPTHVLTMLSKQTSTQEKFQFFMMR